MLERAGRADEAIRILGEDIAEDRYLTQNTLTAYAELLARHGRLDELATGQNAHTILHIYAGALRDHGRAEEAETVMRDAIAADDWVGHRAWLSSALLRDGRLDDAIAVAEPGFSWYDCSNLLVPLVYLLLDRPEDLLYLLEHPLTVPHHGHEEFQHRWRAFALADPCTRSLTPWSRKYPQELRDRAVWLYRTTAPKPQIKWLRVVPQVRASSQRLGLS